MTQLSFPWNCTNPVVGDASPYDLEIVEARSRLLGNFRPNADGVVYWTNSTPFPDVTNPTDELLRPQFVSGNTVRINPGVGMVQGWLFLNDADVDFNVSGGNANAVDIIGLRRDLAANTVRLFHGRGAASSTYSLVQTTAIWEIPLMRVTLNGSGNYSSFQDVRTFVRTPFFPAQKRQYWGNFIGDPNAGGTFPEFGTPLGPSSVAAGYSQFNIPDNIVGNNVNLKFTFFVNNVGSVGQVAQFNALIYYYHSSPNAPSAINGYATYVLNYTITNLNRFITLELDDFTLPASPYPLVLSSPPNTIFRIDFQRNGTAGADTFAGTIFYQGCMLECNVAQSNHSLGLL